MRVLPAKAPSPVRQAVGRPAPQAVPYTFPAAIRGLVEDEWPAQPGGAAVLENFIPTKGGIRVRGGSQLMATVPEPVLGLFDYDDGGAVQRLFAATGTGVYDVSALDGSPGISAVTGMSAVEWVGVQFRTIGGTYLYLVDGHGTPQLFDGAAWQSVDAASTPIAITGATGPFSHVFAFKSRLFFIKQNSMVVYYLPVGAVGGAVGDLSLEGVFTTGGRILFGASWSADSGSGFGDRLVLASEAGEVVVYEGSDPASAADWSKVGQYRIPRPLGRNAWMRQGGDLLIATTEGLISMSSVVSTDVSGLGAASLSRNISRTWSRAAEENRTGWQLARWDTAQVMLAMRPGDNGRVLGRSLETGAWFTIRPWEARTAAMHKGRLYFGGTGGGVMRGDTTGQDEGAPIVARYRGLLETAGHPGMKAVKLCRMSYRSPKDGQAYSLRVVSKPGEDWPSTPTPWGQIESDALWGSGVWDVSRWGGGGQDVTMKADHWHAAGRSAQLIAPEVVIVSDALMPVAAEVLSVDAMIEPGGIVT